MSQKISTTTKRGIVMGFLNILGYIGVGLLVTGIFMGISFAMSRPKQTILYEDGSVERGKGDGDWGVASILSTFTMVVFSTLLLYNLAHFSIIKSIGLGLVASVITFLLLHFILRIIDKTIKHMTANNFWMLLTFIICTLNGASFAILVSVWGWF